LPLIEKRLWAKLQSSISASSRQELYFSNKKHFQWMPLLRIAAVIVVLAGCFYFYRTKSAARFLQMDSRETSWTKKINNGSSLEKLTLEDGTMLELAPNSALYYPPHFDAGKREVRLEGTAFFDVAPNSKAPFYIYARGIMAQVLGTSFWMRYDDSRKQSSVEVVTGKISVHKINEAHSNEVLKAGVILKQNEKVTYSATSNIFNVSLVDVPLPIKKNKTPVKDPGTNFVFEETRLGAVISALENEYGISINVESEDMNDWIFTGDLSGVDYYTRLKLICKSFQATYEIQENRILLKKRK
jgi:hypothetical protein